mmetsp:Transcript_63162/g.175824  ORF Transcript_63162/g.175824 Transcript_63162/m.175824 type:complete len:203 (+) Transcript_63162:110-718(+)
MGHCPLHECCGQVLEMRLRKACDSKAANLASNTDGGRSSTQKPLLMSPPMRQGGSLPDASDGHPASPVKTSPPQICPLQWCSEWRSIASKPVIVATTASPCASSMTWMRARLSTSCVLPLEMHAAEPRRNVDELRRASLRSHHHGQNSLRPRCTSLPRTGCRHGLQWAAAVRMVQTVAAVNEKCSHNVRGHRRICHCRVSNR